jgi:hypothetical protein
MLNFQRAFHWFHDEQRLSCAVTESVLRDIFRGSYIRGQSLQECEVLAMWQWLQLHCG